MQDVSTEIGSGPMFCFQCQQTAKGAGCSVKGVCGKTPAVAASQDELTCELISLAKSARESDVINDETIDMITDGLFTCVTNVNFVADEIAVLSERIRAKRIGMGGEDAVLPGDLFKGDKDAVSLRSALLFGLRGMAAYAHHARLLDKRDKEVDAWFVKGMSALADTHEVGGWLDLIMDFGSANLKCMALLDSANTEAYGDPSPARVSRSVGKGPFIVVTGHDLRDLKMLLEQTDGTGVGVYTHGEMLPAHGYPELRRHKQLAGNYGTAWQNQKKEFRDLPAPILWTTNCITPPDPSYSDRVYTTSVVRYPGAKHIPDGENGRKDFSGLIEHAKRLGGFAEERRFDGAGEGDTLTTGYGRRIVLENAGAIVDAVKSGALRRLFLVGGCDGAHPERSYYTEFVKQTPKDTLVLTLACGKYRFNGLDAGTIGPFPRVLDMGQCNDAYGAVQAAVALAEAFGCGVNDLPLTFVLSWYEQKAVCILLTLLSLGVRDIRLGPSLPAFLSEAVFKTIADKVGLRKITTPEKDLAEALGEG